MPPKAAPPAAAEPLAAAEPHAEESHDTEPDWSTLSASNVFSESFLEYNRGRESHLRDLMRKSKDLGKEVDALKTQHTSTQEALRHFRALRDDLTAGTDRLERGAKAAQQEIYTKLKRFSEHGIQGEPGTPAFMENLVKALKAGALSPEVLSDLREAIKSLDLSLFDSAKIISEGQQSQPPSTDEPAPMQVDQ